jgi:hypothetical protein
MTLLEKLRNEGKQEGKQEGIKGLKEAIETGAAVKFPGDIDTVMAKVNKTDDLETLVAVAKTIYIANDISEILALLK